MHRAYAVDDVLRIGRGMFQRQLQVVHDRQPAGCRTGPFLFPGPYQVFGAALAEVVQLSCGTSPAVLQLTNSCSGLLQFVGFAFSRLSLATVALGGRLLGHDQRAVNSASMTSSESSPGSVLGLCDGPPPGAAPARAEAARDCSI